MIAHKVSKWRDLKVNDLIQCPTTGAFLVVRVITDPCHPTRCDLELLSLRYNTVVKEFGWDTKPLSDMVGNSRLAKYGIWRDGVKIFPSKRLW